MPEAEAKRITARRTGGGTKRLERDLARVERIVLRPSRRDRCRLLRASRSRDSDPSTRSRCASETSPRGSPYVAVSIAGTVVGSDGSWVPHSLEHVRTAASFMPSAAKHATRSASAARRSSSLASRSRAPPARARAPHARAFPARSGFERARGAAGASSRRFFQPTLVEHAPSRARRRAARRHSAAEDSSPARSCRREASSIVAEPAREPCGVGGLAALLGDDHGARGLLEAPSASASSSSAIATASRPSTA